MTARAIAKLTADIARLTGQVETQAETIVRLNRKAVADKRRIAGIEAANERQQVKLNRAFAKAQIWKESK